MLYVFASKVTADTYYTGSAAMLTGLHAHSCFTSSLEVCPDFSTPRKLCLGYTLCPCNTVSITARQGAQVVSVTLCP